MYISGGLSLGKRSTGSLATGETDSETDFPAFTKKLLNSSAISDGSFNVTLLLVTILSTDWLLDLPVVNSFNVSHTFVQYEAFYLLS